MDGVPTAWSGLHRRRTRVRCQAHPGCAPGAHAIISEGESCDHGGGLERGLCATACGVDAGGPPSRLRKAWLGHIWALRIRNPPSGIVDDTVFLEKVIRPLLLEQAAALPPQTAVVRRLFFESHALAVGELKQRMERTDTDAPRKGPQAEREARKKAVRAKLAPGLLVEVDLEPANCVVVEMVDDNSIEWVPWEEVAKRDQELASQPGEKRWMADATGLSKEKVVRTDATADTS